MMLQKRVYQVGTAAEAGDPKPGYLERYGRARTVG